MSSRLSRPRAYALGAVAAVAAIATVASISTIATSAPTAKTIAPRSEGPSTAEDSRLAPVAMPTASARVAQNIFEPGTISEVAERVSPAVVSITTRGSTERRRAPREDIPGFFFGPRESPPAPEVGVASGVIISETGEIVTNNHVVASASEVTVKLSDGRELKAKVIGTDAPSDLALVKIEASGLPFLRFGDSSRLRLGEFVLAIGNPFGVGQTVTMGIVSAKGRSNVGIVDYEDFIQTDAAINPGNSGGALVSLDGALVGINTAILSKSGGAAGIGFAVPASLVRPVVEQIRQHGKVRRGWLGVAIQDLTPELSRALGIREEHGVVVSDVISTGPAAAAGLESGDVVLSVDGQKVSTAAELRNRVAMLEPGTKAEMAIRREGESKTLIVKLAEKKDDGDRRGDSAAQEGPLAGLNLETLTPALRRRLEVPDKLEGGVIVTEIEPSSAADRAGLRPGDIIVSVNRRPVSSVEDVERLAANKGDILLRVFRQGSLLFLVVQGS